MKQPIFDNLKETFKRGNIFVQLIYINVGVFFITSLVSLFFTLFNQSDKIASFIRYFELPASFTRFLLQPWSLFTYMFMHADILHILFNMLWLYWFGNLFLHFFSSKHLRGLYVFGGICGGLLFMIAYKIFPYFAENLSLPLVGASAAILAIVVAVAYREPNYPIRLLFLGTFRLKYLALIVVAMDLLLMTSSNAGGHIAHLGGALAGLWFAASLDKGADLTKWINISLDWLGSLFEKKTWKRKKKPTMKVHYNRDPKDYNYNAQKKAQSEEIDRILDKLKKSGYDSLTTDEKKSLFDASKR